MSLEAPTAEHSETDAADHRRPAPHRRRRVKLLLAFVVVLAAIAAAVVLTYAKTYDPLALGSIEGSRSELLRPLSDGVDRTRYAHVGKPGSKGSVLYSLRNDGRHTVTVLGSPPDAWGAVEPRWAPIIGSDSRAGGQPEEVSSFPVDIAPGEEIALWVSVTQPPCSDDFGATDITSIPLRWKALGQEHLYRLRLGSESRFAPITVCPPNSIQFETGVED